MSYPMDTDERIFVVGLGAIGLLLCVAVYGAILSGLTKNECLRAGYRTGGATITFARYCATRIDQTDVVRPLHEVRRQQ